MRHESYVARQDKIAARQKCPLTWCFSLLRDIIRMLATYPPWLATKYDLSKYDAKTMFSVIILSIARTGTFQYTHSEGIL